LSKTRREIRHDRGVSPKGGREIGGRDVYRERKGPTGVQAHEKKGDEKCGNSSAKGLEHKQRRLNSKEEGGPEAKKPIVTKGKEKGDG